MDGDVNPFKKGFTKAPFSPNYRKILTGRKKLPVFDKMQEFFDVVSGD
jgi:pre-mRNA-splicing factor ATP-dependent RNA helicase DHX15/PRP43